MRQDTRDREQLAITARTSRVAPIVPWTKFLRDVLVWGPSQHFGLIGPTGQGKTTMTVHLLPQHPYTAVFATKPRDATMDSLIESDGYLRMERWEPLDPVRHPRRVLWPDATTFDSVDKQKAVFHDALDQIYREGGWTVNIDELWYFTVELGLKRDVDKYYSQARSNGISLLAGTQRPANVPVAIYSQSTHLMFWQNNDENDLKRIAGTSRESAATMRHIAQNLHQWQVLYVNTRSGRMARTTPPKL